MPRQRTITPIKEYKDDLGQQWMLDQVYTNEARIWSDHADAATVTIRHTVEDVEVAAAEYEVKSLATTPQIAAVSQTAQDIQTAVDAQGFDWDKLWADSKQFGQDALPYISAGLDVFSGISAGKAIREQGKASASNLRRQGARALEQASRSAENVRIKNRFTEAGQREEIGSSPLFQGSGSVQEGSLFSSVLESNKAAAIKLSQEIIQEGEAQKREYDAAADAAEKAAKEASKGSLWQGIGSAVGSAAGFALGGPMGGAAGSKLGGTIGREAAT